MWHLSTPFRKRFEARRAAACRRRWYRPHCESLEHRCLPSVLLAGPTAGLVGTPVTWTATATGDGTIPVYQFSVESTDGVSHVVRDFTLSNSLTWNPMQEGSYDIQVTVKDSFGAPSGESASTPYTAISRVVGTSAVVSATSNALVALYSAPPSYGSTMYVQFSPMGPEPSWQSTAPQPTFPGESTNFLVAGMLPNTTYLMRDVVDDGTTSAPVTFTTGSLPRNVAFPTFGVQQAPTPGIDPTQDMVYHAGVNTTPGVVDLLATDLAGNIDWYYDPAVNNFAAYGPSLVPGGTILTLGGQPAGVAGGYDTLREIDLLGDPLRETNIDAINAQLAAMGQKDSIIDFDHDALRLPNGDTAVLASNQRTINVNGKPTLYTGNMIIVLDENFQVTWVWDAFDWLSTSRLPTNGEGPSDWLHGNSISWSPEDGDLLVSLRAQDSVLKINYDNGAGDGHIVWTLGAGGNFSIISSDPSPWFSHQHDVRYINDTTLVVFDDGNTRRLTDPNADSRGQELVLNEQTMTATLVANVDLGNYSPALGSAQVLPNGNLDFTSGDQLSGLNAFGQSIEVSPDGTEDYVMEQTGIEYRSYFMSNLYGGANFSYGLLDSGFENPSQGTGTSAYQADPTAAAWSFGGSAGVAGNGSAITGGNPHAPEGSQVAFIQGTGTISQVVNFLFAGSYQLSLSGAQSSNNGPSNEAVQVQVDDTVVATFAPTSTSYAMFTTPSFAVTAGSHTITFVGVDPTGSESTALLDKVSILSDQLPGTATFVTPDTTTQGNWTATYGLDGYNVIGDVAAYPSYAQVSSSGYSNYLWTTTSTDPRALQEIGSSNGIAAAWYSPTILTFNITVTDNQTHQLALYLLDWDQFGGGRSEQVQILDATTGKVLSSQTVSQFSQGEYLLWDISGAVEVQITNLNGSSNAVVNGLFFDPTMPIITTNPVNDDVGIAFSQTLHARGGSGPYTFSATSGTLPSGLTFTTGGVLSGTPTAIGSYSFTVTAKDALGSSASQPFTVTINPAVAITTMALANDNVGIVYNQTLNALGGNGTYTFSRTSGTLPSGLTLNSVGVLSGTPTAIGSYSFTVTATDALGSSDSHNYTVIIQPPVTMLLVTAPPTATAGVPFTVTVMAADGSGQLSGAYSGTVMFGSSVGVDISPTIATLTNGTAMVTVTLTTAGLQTITAMSSGLTSGTAQVTVNPGALGQYFVNVLGASTAQAGSSFLVTVQAADVDGNLITSSYSGPATVMASINPSSSASNFPTTVPISSAGFGFFIGALDQVGSYMITAASGSVTGSTSTPMTVTPGPAAKLAFAAQPVNTPTGDVLPTVTVVIQDQFGNVVTNDNSDAVMISIGSGPGAFTAGSTTATARNGVVSFSNLTVAVLGTYTLHAVLPSATTYADSNPFTVTPLQVVPGSFAATPSGFSVQLNAPFLVNSLTPALYGSGFGAGATVTPTITLIQTSGTSPAMANLPYQIPGSLIVNTANNTLTFLETDTTSVVNNGTPLLPDGIYVVDITSSRANGLQALMGGGGYLDGTASGTPGHDFTATFTVGAAAAGDDVLWVPATADGPGQALSAPGMNQVGGGLPVYIDDSTGQVTSVLVTVNYNSSMLTVTGATSNSTLSGSSFTLLGSSTPGQAVLQYTGSTANAANLLGGEVPLGFLTATVPNGSPATPIYRGKDLLHLSNLSINDGAVQVVGGDALHLVAYVGDADGNGAYTSADAVLITRVLVSTDDGFAAYPLVDPTIVADTDGSGFIPPDASLQVNEAGVGFPTGNLTRPPIPTGANITPIGNNVDPSLSIPTSLQVGADGAVTVPVDIDDGHPVGSTGLLEAHLALIYDPRQFTVAAVDVHAGSLLSGGHWSIVPTIDQATGQIGIALSSDTPITSTIGGSLVTIAFHPTGTISGPAFIELAASADPYGQYVTTELEDAQGTFTLSPAPTNGFDPRIDGMVVLAPAPTATPISIPGEEAAITVPAAASDVQPADGRYAQDVTMVESAGPGVEAAPIDMSERETGPVPTIAVDNVSAGQHLTAVGASSYLASMAVAMSAGPLGSLVFQGGGSPPGLPVIATQRQGDQFFQALGHWLGGPADTIPPRMGTDSFERILIGRLFLSLPTVDNLDNLTWEKVSSDLEWEGIGDPLTRDGRSDTASQPHLQCSVPQAGADQVLLDRCFSQMVADMDQIAADE